MKREEFIRNSALVIGGTFMLKPFNILANKSKNTIIGHGKYQYSIDLNWGKLDSDKFPVNDCHEMVFDKNKRLFLLTNEPKNNVLIYDKFGKLLKFWTLNLSGAHGLTLNDENGTEFLYITDYMLGEVYKTTLEGKVLLTIKHPKYIGQYQDCEKFAPTETCIGPTGDIYIADGYGSQFILQYNSKGEFIRKFGGDSAINDAKFKQVHGIALDTRNPNDLKLICSERMKNCFKQFSLNGDYLGSIYMPGAYLSRPVIKGDMLYAGVCYSALKNHYLTMNSGFVTILDRNNKVVSNPGGTKPIYKNGELQLMLQEQQIFKHCHDVCIDDEENIYVAQWNAGKVYPYKLSRV